MLLRLRERLTGGRSAFARLSGDDGEDRTFWQDLGLQIGARRTGTFCLYASKDDVTEERRVRIQKHVDRICSGSRRLISDNAHLLNKIGFVAEALPQSKFILVIRQLESVVAEWKSGFNKANTNNEDYPAFVHYWPECEFPCWYVLRNDLSRPRITTASLRRWAVGGARFVGLKKGHPVALPWRPCSHEKLSSFLETHPDQSRYYPGEGFCRLPEAWIKMNHNALLQLQQLEPKRWRIVCFEDLVSDPRETIERMLDFLGWDACNPDAASSVMDSKRASVCASLPTEAENDCIHDVVKRHSSMVDAIRQIADRELCQV